MKREILVPLDGSELAEGALPHAVALARATYCGLVLLRTVQPPTWLVPVLYGKSNLPTAAEIYTEQAANAGAYLQRVAELLKSKGLEVRTEVQQGEPASTITSYARECLGITAIVMSTHGRSGLKRWIMGSIAEKVVHSSPRPVLLARSPECATQESGAASLEPATLETILVPLDGSQFAEQALEEACDIASGTGAKIELLAVVEKPDTWSMADDAVASEWYQEGIETEEKNLDRYLTQVAARLTLEGLRVEKKRVSGDPADEIIENGLADADLIVMATHGRSGWQQLWLGSVAKKVVQHSTIPVLLVRPDKPLPTLEIEHSMHSEADETEGYKEGTLHTSGWLGRHH